MTEMTEQSVDRLKTLLQSIPSTDSPDRLYRQIGRVEVLRGPLQGRVFHFESAIETYEEWAIAIACWMYSVLQVEPRDFKLSYTRESEFPLVAIEPLGIQLLTVLSGQLGSVHINGEKQ